MTDMRKQRSVHPAGQTRLKTDRRTESMKDVSKRRGGPRRCTHTTDDDSTYVCVGVSALTSERGGGPHLQRFTLTAV